MEKTLINKLKYFLNNFNAVDINEYFNNGSFEEDCIKYYDNNTPKDILEYLNDTFMDIDIDFRDTDKFEDKVKETLNIVIEKLKDAN